MFDSRRKSQGVASRNLNATLEVQLEHHRNGLTPRQTLDLTEAHRQRAADHMQMLYPAEISRRAITPAQIVKQSIAS